MQPAGHGAAGARSSCSGHGLPRFDGNHLLLEPCSQAVALKAALAAEFRRCRAGWSPWGSCRDQYLSQVCSTPKAARCNAGQCLMALWHSRPRGALPQHLHMGSCLDSCPKPSLKFPCSPELAMFRQLRSDGSFMQEPLQLLLLLS